LREGSRRSGRIPGGQFPALDSACLSWCRSAVTNNYLIAARARTEGRHFCYALQTLSRLAPLTLTDPVTHEVPDTATTPRWCAEARRSREQLYATFFAGCESATAFEAAEIKRSVRTRQPRGLQGSRWERGAECLSSPVSFPGDEPPLSSNHEASLGAPARSAHSRHIGGKKMADLMAQAALGGCQSRSRPILRAAPCRMVRARDLPLEMDEFSGLPPGDEFRSKTIRLKRTDSSPLRHWRPSRADSGIFR